MGLVVKLANGFIKFTEHVAVVILCAMVVLVTGAVILRYSYGITFQWLEEVSRYGQIAIVLFLLGPSVFRESHIKMDMVFNMLKGNVKRTVDFINLLSVLFVTIYTFGKSIELVSMLYGMGILTLSNYFELWMPTVIVPIGMGTAIIFTILRLILKIYGKKYEGTPAAEAHCGQASE